MADLSTWKRENLEHLAADLLTQNERLRAENSHLTLALVEARNDAAAALNAWRAVVASQALPVIP